ncbi:MAG TPA: hydantoinase B/oxoprolinase family protein [Burkholderiales bacterium]
MSIDPITFEIVRHRLFRIVEEAIITLKNVSGSSTTNEGHDLMVSLYTADGGLLMGGVGFLHHLSSASAACKAIIARFGERICEGDVYLLNDPYTAALHTSDVYLVAPVHFRGKLVAWSACFVHINDIGAMNPGGFCPEARDIFSEGFSSPGIRLVHKGETCTDVLDTLLNMVRSPEMVALDIRSMIACNNVAGERLTALLGKYGEAVVTAVGEELIRQSETLLRQRLRELPDGRWTARQYMDVEGRPLQIRLAMTKQGDSLTFDFTGSSEQVDRGVNCTRWAAWGGLLAPLYPLLCYDIVWNEGVLKPIRMIAPEGSIVNCRRPAPVSIATTAAVQAVNNASLICISKMLASSPAYRKDATAVWHGSHLCLYLFARDKRGDMVIGSTTETFGGSGGATWLRDGLDIGGEIPNPISRMANVETNEATFPIRYLFRRRVRDSGGLGWHRGGTGGEYAIVATEAADQKFGFVVSGKGVQFPMGHGLAGGYPGAPGRYVICRGAIRDDGDPQSRFPLRFEEIGGRHEVVSWGVFDVGPGDVLYVRWNGAGGLGDPLDRDPDAVARDVREGIVSRESALANYGVVLDADHRVDVARTRAERAALRAARLGIAPKVPADPARKYAGAACESCGLTAPGPRNGSGLQVRERPMRELGPVYTTGDATLSREILCPDCGTLLEVQVSRSGDEVLLDEAT